MTSKELQIVKDELKEIKRAFLERLEEAISTLETMEEVTEETF